MMFIKKWPRVNFKKKYTFLKISQKCKYCKTIVEMDSLNDLDYVGVFSLEGGSILPTLDHRYHFNYVCPYCERDQMLSIDNLDYITKFIGLNNIDMKPYEMMERISHSVEPYNVFRALWLNSKYGVKIRPSLVDEEATRIFNENMLEQELEDQDGDFVTLFQFEKIMLRIKSKKDEENKIGKLIQSVSNDTTSTRICKVGWCEDAEGLMNICLQTDGSVCILLVCGSDGRVIRQTKMPANRFRFYEREMKNGINGKYTGFKFI